MFSMHGLGEKCDEFCIEYRYCYGHQRLVRLSHNIFAVLQLLYCSDLFTVLSV
jgi:hypothetical protein